MDTIQVLSVGGFLFSMGAAGANAHVSNIVGGFLFSMGAAGANAHVSNIVVVSFSLLGLLERMHMSPML